MREGKTMDTVDKIRNGLIDKILSISNKEFLLALDGLIKSSKSSSTKVPLTEEQKIMLEMSDMDIQQGKTISQDDMVLKKLEWLNRS